MRTTLFAATALSILITGCAQKLKMTVNRPAEFQLSAYNKIALTVEDRTDEEDLVGRMVAGAAKKIFGRKPKNPAELMEERLEKSLASTPFEMVPAEEASQPGVFLVRAVIIRNYYSQRITSKMKKEKGDSFLEYTAKGTTSFKLHLEGVDGQTNERLFEKVLSHKESTESTSENPEPLINKDSLLKKCMDAVSKKFPRLIAPWSQTISLRFRKDKSIPQLEKGFKAAKEGDWDTAIALFEEGTKSEAKVVHKAYYNLGVALTYQDRFDEARSALNAAIDVHAHDDYLKARRDLGQRVKEQGILSGQEPSSQGEPSP